MGNHRVPVLVPQQTTTRNQEREEKEMNWRDKAACKGVPVEVFFHNRGGNKYRDPYQQARQHCAACPVRLECLQWIMSVETEPTVGRWGYYGGMTPQQRLDLARRQRVGSAA